jgi:ribosomal protein L7/L12
MDIPFDLQTKIESLLAQKRKLEAIKLLIDETHCGLKAAKDYIDGLTVSSDTTVLPSLSYNHNIDAELKSLLSQSKKLEAVKRYRAHTGLGLKESKDYIDALSSGYMSIAGISDGRNTQIDDAISAHIGKSKSGCFIATACYGNYDAPEVLVLRRFRDERLLPSNAGKLFVRFYYAVSPPLARWLSKSEKIKKQVRKYLLQPLVELLRK